MLLVDGDFMMSLHFEESLQLAIYRYQFVVLPDNRAIHVPHVETKYSKQFLIVSKNLCNDTNGTCI